MNDGNEDGTFYKLPENMRKSLVQFALNFAPEMKRHTTEAVKRQRAAKLEKQNILRKRKLIAAQSAYAIALSYIEFFHSNNGWRTEAQCRKAFSKLGSKTARLEAVKTQIRIRTVGFGWKDLHHSWSKDGKHYLPEELLEHLTHVMIPEQKKRGIPKVPPVKLPSCGDRPQLGTVTEDMIQIDK